MKRLLGLLFILVMVSCYTSTEPTFIEPQYYIRLDSSIYQIHVNPQSLVMASLTLSAVTNVPDSEAVYWETDTMWYRPTPVRGVTDTVPIIDCCRPHFGGRANAMIIAPRELIGRVVIVTVRTKDVSDRAYVVIN